MYNGIYICINKYIAACMHSSVGVFVFVVLLSGKQIYTVFVFVVVLFSGKQIFTLWRETSGVFSTAFSIQQRNQSLSHCDDK